MKRGERDVGPGSVLAGAFKGDRCVGHDHEGLRQAARAECAKAILVAQKVQDATIAGELGRGSRMD